MKTKTKKTRSQLDKKLWKIFSQYIRKRDKYICFTCGKQCDVTNSQAGHYLSRRYTAIKYDERNVHCQCVRCNVMEHGNPIEYQRNLKARYYKELPDELYDLKNVYADHSVPWYEEQIQIYTDKLQSLE